MRKRYSNRQAFVEVFWEHVLPLGPLGAFAEWVRREAALHKQFALYEGLAERTIALMQVDSERMLVTKANKTMFNGRLTPGPDLLAPGRPFTTIEAAKDCYQAMSSWYGSERAKEIRLGRDLRNYVVPDLLLRPVEWTQIQGSEIPHPTWAVSSPLQDWVVQMQPFPSKHLYRLQLQRQPIWEFDDWPEAWLRELRGEGSR